MEHKRFVGLDVGGSTMKGGVVDDAGLVLASVNLPTEAHRCTRRKTGWQKRWAQRWSRPISGALVR